MLLNCGIGECLVLLESHLDCKEIQPVHPKGNQSWIFIGRTNAEAETPILWPPDVKNWLIWKDPDAGKDWGQEEKGTTEDEMVGWQSLTQWTWVWVNSGSWWWTGMPGMLWFMGLQRVGHDWVTERNWTAPLATADRSKCEQPRYKEFSVWVVGRVGTNGRDNYEARVTLKYGHKLMIITDEC